MDINLHNKRVLVIGAGISGFAAAKIARKFGAEVTLSDAQAKEKIKFDFTPLERAGINLVFGPQTPELLENVDLVIVSPAVPWRVPIIKAASERKIPVMGEIELAYGLAKAPVCAVTGTNGKTTTVTLLGLLLKAHYHQVGVGGNIGVPLSEEALKIPADGYLAAEISSYQLEGAKNFKPHVSAILNLTPDHLKRHGDMDGYQAMKERIFARETADDFVVLNYDDERVRSMAERAPAQVFFFSRREKLTEGACLDGDHLVIRRRGDSHELCSVAELGIKGAHNVENALAAAAVAFLAGVKPQEMTPVLKSFRGVEHRIEFTREINGVPYYNDSKATNTDSAIKALETFPAHIILLAGGDDKGTDLTDFMDLVRERADELILIGDAAERFNAAALESGYPAEHIHRAGYDMDKAIKTAHSLAKPPQVVLLSPACASFDMYDNFEERGKDFKRKVNDL